MARKKQRIAVIDRGFISPYFDEFFSILNRTEDREYVVFHGRPPRNTGLQAACGPFSFPNIWVENRELLKTAVYQPLVNQVTSGEYDAVIMGHELKFVSNWLAAAICKAKGIPVILWGFGYHAPRGIGYRTRGSKVWARCASHLKDLTARFADGYLAYTDRGAARIQSLDLGCEVFVVQPSVNVKEQTALHQRFVGADRGRLRAELGLRPDSIVFLYIGRLVEAKNAVGLVELVERLNRDPDVAVPVEARIIGGGEQLEALQARTRDSGEVAVLGEIYDQELLARHLAAADAMVLPGAAGITVTHAFAHGKPVLMRASPLHSPEAEYVVDGVNGLVSPAPFDDFVAVAKRFIASSDLRRRVSDGALATREKFSMERMAGQFDAAVDRVFSTHERRASRARLETKATSRG